MLYTTRLCITALVQCNLYLWVAWLLNNANYVTLCVIPLQEFHTLTIKPHITHVV